MLTKVLSRDLHNNYLLEGNIFSKKSYIVNLEHKKALNNSTILLSSMCFATKISYYIVYTAITIDQTFDQQYHYSRKLLQEKFRPNPTIFRLISAIFQPRVKLVHPFFDSHAS